MSVLENAQDRYDSSNPHPKRPLSCRSSPPKLAAGPEHHDTHNHGYNQEINIPRRVKQHAQNEHVGMAESYWQIPKQQDCEKQEQQIRIGIKLHHFFPEITPCSNIKSARR